MAAKDGTNNTVDLADAIEALRAAIAKAWLGDPSAAPKKDGDPRSRVRFQIEPIELTINAGVTQTGQGSAGVKWHVISLGGSRSRESVTTQTLKLRLAPVLLDERGNALPPGHALIAGPEDDTPSAENDKVLPEPE